MSEKIIVDTYSLKSYANRIKRLNTRINRLDRQIRNLYFTRKVGDLYYFVQKNQFLDVENILSKSETYLYDTASDFDMIENYFSRVDPLNYTNPHNHVISFANRDDKKGGRREGLTTFARFCVSNEFESNGEITKNVLDKIGKVLKNIGKIKSDDDIDFGSAVWDYFSNVFDYIFNTDNLYDVFTGGVSLIKDTGDVYSALFEYLSKGNYGSDLILKYGQQFTGLAVLTSGQDVALSFLDAYDKYAKYKNGDASIYDFLSSIICTTGKEITFAGSAAMFWNWTKPGQVQILADGTITAGWVKNTEYLKNAGMAMRISNAYFKFAQEAVERYGTYHEDGTVDLGEIGKIGVESSLQALNSLLLYGIIPDEWVDKGAIFLEEDFGGKASDKLASYDWVWEYTSHTDNTWTNNAATRGAVRIGATAVAIGETSVEWMLDSISKLFN